MSKTNGIKLLKPSDAGWRTSWHKVTRALPHDNRVVRVDGTGWAGGWGLAFYNHAKGDWMWADEVGLSVNETGHPVERWREN